MEKRYWLIWAVLNMVMGICGFVILAFAYMIGLQQAFAHGGSQTWLYAALAIAFFVLLLAVHMANRVIYRVFSERSGGEAKAFLVPFGDVLSFAATAAVYVIFAFL